MARHRWPSASLLRAATELSGQVPAVAGLAGMSGVGCAQQCWNCNGSLPALQRPLGSADGTWLPRGFLKLEGSCKLVQLARTASEWQNALRRFQLPCSPGAACAYGSRCQTHFDLSGHIPAGANGVGRTQRPRSACRAARSAGTGCRHCWPARSADRTRAPRCTAGAACPEGHSMVKRVGSATHPAYSRARLAPTALQSKSSLPG